MSEKLIIVQWENYFGGLEKISKLYEEEFSKFNPLVVILRPVKLGFIYNNSFIFKTKNNFKFILEYFYFAKKRKTSIFHLQYTGAAILLFTYLAGVRNILYHFHGTKFPNDSLTKMIWKLLENKVWIIANSSYTEQVIRKKLGIKKDIVILPNLIDTLNFSFKEREFDENNFIVTFVGRFDKGKNVELVIETARVMHTLDPKVFFRLVGDGPEKEVIEKKISDYGLTERIKLEPFTSKVSDVYYSSHLLLFPSLYESFGNVVAEAILTGLPVLCYKIPALEELITDETFFFEFVDAKLVAEKIIDLKKNYNTIKHKLIMMEKQLRTYLDNDSIIKKLETIYLKFEK